jgi:hypothetical protein
MFKEAFQRQRSTIFVLDEGNPRVRRKNKLLLDGLPHRFYGPKERREYFLRTFGRMGAKVSHVIPDRCHAETSFGFLLAYQERPDIILELDDDTFPAAGHSMVGQHVASIGKHECPTVSCSGGWYNTFENLRLNASGIFPRGHPYDALTRSGRYHWSTMESRIVLNMGLWLGHPDFDALTILSQGGLDGRSNVKSIGIKRNQLVVGKGTYFALCSMNVAFKPEIVPAFYQLYMNYMGLDRFDDIWSGIFLKRIVDHLGVNVSVGAPAVRHVKRPRDIFRDLRAELEGMAINEILWRTVNSLNIEGNDYWTAYRSLALGLEHALGKMSNLFWRKLLRQQTRKMQAWLRLFERL